MRLNAVLIRVIKEIFRDKRTLALILLAPILVLTLMKFVLTDTTDTTYTIGVSQDVPASVVSSLKKTDMTVKTYDDTKESDQLIKEKKLAALIELDGTTYNITYSNDDPSATAAVKNIFNRVLLVNQLQTMGENLKKVAQIGGQKIENKSYTVKNSYIYGDSDSSFFDKIFPILIGFFVFFFVFLISGIALLRERTSGTLERLLATPIKRSEIVLGYLIGYGSFAILQTLIMVFYSLYILNIHLEGSLLLLLLTNILVALVALSMGIFVSTFANSEFQMIQFIPIVVIPQVLFAGIIPLETMADWLQSINFIFPLRYAGQALSDIMIRGFGFQDIWENLAILLIFTALFTGLNIIGLKRYRKV